MYLLKKHARRALKQFRNKLRERVNMHQHTHMPALLRKMDQVSSNGCNSVAVCITECAQVLDALRAAHTRVHADARRLLARENSACLEAAENFDAIGKQFTAFARAARRGVDSLTVPAALEPFGMPYYAARVANAIVPHDFMQVYGADLCKVLRVLSWPCCSVKGGFGWAVDLECLDNNGVFPAWLERPDAIQLHHRTTFLSDLVVERIAETILRFRVKVTDAPINSFGNSVLLLNIRANTTPSMCIRRNNMTAVVGTDRFWKW